MNIAHFFRILGLLACSALATQAQARAGHAGHKGAKVELGTSAALDAQGRLWIASTDSGTEHPLLLQVSGDMGRIWSAPARIAQVAEAVAAEGESRPKLAFGSRGEIYIAYTKPLSKPYTGEIRFVRSLDGGQTFSAPATVHANRDEITHRFESMIVDKSGRIYIAWVDKRDAEAAKARKETYRGAAIYYTVSEDGGASFRGDFKLADHSCECCRIALALNQDGAAVAMWRHVFEPNVRDHAMRELRPDGPAAPLVRTTFDDWRLDACPHHGPALAYGPDGTRHQVWFNAKGDEGGVFYAATGQDAAPGVPVSLGSAQAAHAEVMAEGKAVAIVWKQFDGKSTAILARYSDDGGLAWKQGALASTQGNSDHPHLLASASGMILVWRTQNEGVRVLPVTGATQ
ncbi:MAG: sialidase family protein [Telluria sp.]|nr:sialidase family protein [Telluria sp.]